MTQAHVDRQAQILAMTEALAEDSLAALQAVFKDDSQRARRHMFRAFFAEIEGAVFGFKYLAVAGHEIRSHPLSEAEIALARESSFELDDKGDPQVRAARIRFCPNLLFALRLLARFYVPAWKPDTSDSRWGALKDASRVRDRLMHPKALKDIEVGDDEMLALAQGYDWYASARAEIWGQPPAKRPGPFESLVLMSRAR